MSTGNATRYCGALLAIAIAAGLQGCDKPAAQATPAATAQAHYQPIKIEHPLGTTLITKLPERVVAFDMSELDTLDQLGAPVVGIAKDYVASLIVAHEKSLADAVILRDAAGAANDLETQDLAIGRIQWHQKTLWMLKSYLK